MPFALTTGALFASGDLIAQVGVERKTSDYNPLRTARLGLFGSCVAGPAMVSWYGLLSRRIVFENRLMALLARVSLDQLVFAPTFIAIFFSATGFMEGLTPEAVWDKLKSGYPTALAGNYKLWPAVQLVNFYLVPLHHQALVVNTIALGWNTYLSVINQRSTFKENPEST
ncbi:Protein required for ethanol metabolism [Polyrhizophydium stewartii]|uniref:Protein required for ethanol metabolism n=1 Tax=Polyrhizophydium stewartii TaxID=2732419 RepID=A0ABR4NF37_9FUNG